MRCDVKQIVSIASDLKIKTPRPIDAGLPDIVRFVVLFGPLRRDGEDFEVGTQLVFQKAFEFSGEFGSSSLRTAENSRDASRGVFLKFLCFSMQ